MWVRLLVILVWLPVQADAAIFRWTDDNGRQRFSDRPPLEDDGAAPPGQITPIDNALPPLSRMDGGNSRTGIARPPGKGKVTLAPTSSNGLRCGHYRAAIERIDSKLRAGYTPKQGRKLEDRRRHYSDWMFRNCRGS